MLKIAVVGGKLQGTEALYLARKAGIKSLLIDKNENSIASGICDELALFDVRNKEKALIDLLKTADFILPALENDEVHQALLEIAQENNLKLAFDMPAYAVSSSKLKSDELIRMNQIPSPRYYPYCKKPYIIKPSRESGSSGVRRANTDIELEAFLNTKGKKGNWVIQEFLDGPSYSIEVIGMPGNYRTYRITKIHMDEVYDCKRVTSPCPVTEAQRKRFTEIGCELAELINLHGIMDVEVIDDEGMLKVLEIDARIPSQTPTVVYHASGMNQLEELADIVLYGDFRHPLKDLGRHCSYEHFKINKNGYFSGGEHIMCKARPLILQTNFFGADEALTDYDEEHDEWHGTFINWADTGEELERKRNNMIQKLKNSFPGADREVCKGSVDRR
ncbi:3-methylornithine--L-lysine ligase PylC [Sinanaerobacter chloroacetimidivorans]|uniref:3-methylornithine--L-lysine ligase PylC n=1 Tax=Sinanaerobacter chloroacetimidivorans TaxID=2818044 RepID=A0A8J8B138_9FIRM|nr:3-methylornithine--L-lysine ligase PylC [Sinanaerobacter chloroacetimidivorans]MBR0597367.1 3-methylornithine--L-lysine ligase PylC [Sinanaerobacter chloroacetimidivorans]